MYDLTIRAATRSDRETIIELSAESVAVTSPMDSDRFEYLFECCTLCLIAAVDGDTLGFLIAMTDEADYENANFKWFSRQLKNFIYIDRVVVSKDALGRGLGSSLYSHALTWMFDKRLHSIAAEMDLDPPNIRSLEFHKAKGFVELGTRKLSCGKMVSMQVWSPSTTIPRKRDA